MMVRRSWCHWERVGPYWWVLAVLGFWVQRQRWWLGIGFRKRGVFLAVKRWKAQDEEFQRARRQQLINEPWRNE